MVEPRTLKHYEILSRLGEGGMGVVYRARDTRLGRIVALKVLSADLSRDKEHGLRFEREARIVSSLSHPGIATLYDFDHDGDATFLIMEYVEGSTLRQLLEDGPLPVDDLLDCAVQVAEALSAAHQQGVVHRDLKPANIMRSDTGHYKVLDFGVAHQELAAPGADYTRRPTVAWQTKAGSLVGTVAYMSPEQTLGKETDRRSDIFSFGSLLYELATGKPAFPGANEIAVAQAISLAEPAAMTDLRPEIPLDLDAVVRRCLAKAPGNRYQSADDLAQDLRMLRLDSQSGARTAAYRLKALAPARRRRRRVWIASGAAVVILVAGALLAPRLLGPAPAAPVGGTPFVGSGSTAVPPSGSESVGFSPGLPGLQPAAVLSGDRPRVVVAFFENNSGDDAASWLSRGLPDMLTTDLSRWEQLDIIAPQRLHDLMSMAGRDSGEKMDRSTAAELARWAGAGLVITGSVFKAGEQYRIDAQAYDTATGTVVVAHNVVGTELFDMVGELAAGLREGLLPDGDMGSAPVSDIRLATTSSEAAYEAYMRSRTLGDNLDYAGAAEHCRQALAIDPEFSRARLQLASILLMDGDREEALAIIEAAAGQTESMPKDARLATEVLHACFKRGDFETCTSRLEELTRQYPEKGETYVWWARALVELRGDTLGATSKLHKAIARDPNNLPAFVALAGHLASVGRTGDAVSLLEQAREHNPAAREVLQLLIESYSETASELG